MSTVKAPWLAHYGEVPASLSYPNDSMFCAVERIAQKYPRFVALDFMGKHINYKDMVREIELCARSLKAIGIKKDDRVTICLPNCPQAIIMFYAINVVGAIANMIHPLSAEKEIEFYICESKSVAAITLDQFYHKFEAIRQNVELDHLIITSIKDALPQPLKTGYILTEGRKIKKVPPTSPVIFWKKFLRLGKRYRADYRLDRVGSDPAVILYSGGTTGTTKGIVLSNLNFNALGAQIVATNPMFRPGDTMLAVMPIFHGFGLGVSIHSMLVNGGRCILVPRFTPESYARLVKKHRCNFIAGVPTLYEAFLRQPIMKGVDLSSLKGVFSGGDCLSIELKNRFDTFLKEHNATIQVREGYGMTECVTASCLTPYNSYKKGSIGLPFPDTFYKIVRVGTTEEVPYGEEGEMCISGPTVMLEYMDRPEETANTLRVHDDGMTWVHTGDLGYMDDEGFVYFKQRIKRMIITSGYNVYPSQLENILDAHELVHMSCIIGIPDSYKMQKVKAFIMLKPGVEPSDENKDILMAHCRKNMARYAMPCDMEFRSQLPKTLVGKVAYRELEAEEVAKLNATADQSVAV